MSASAAQAEWPTSSDPTGTRVTGHCSTCTAGRVSEDAAVTRIDHISAMADARFLCFCDRCLAIIASFAPAVRP